MAVANYGGQVIEYNSAWRMSKKEDDLQVRTASNSFEQMIPFLKKWKQSNVNLVVDWQVDQHKW